MALSPKHWRLALFISCLYALLSTGCAGSQPVTSTQPGPVSGLTPSRLITTIISAADTGADAGWKPYTNQQYRFSFIHPNLNDTCCRIAGPASGNAELIITLADETTVRPNTDARFDGLAIYVVPNEENLALDEYIKQEKEALLELREAFGVESSLPRTEAPITIDGQKGVLLQGYSWDHIIRMYVPFPDSQKLLVIEKTEESDGSFEVFDQILASFRFVRQ